jgi:coenzyme F420 hydrogenase subunit beta
MFAPSINKSEGFEGLKRDVIEKDFCTYCGACASFCEHLILNGKPELKDDCPLINENVLKCSENGTCYDVCPMTETNITVLEKEFLNGDIDADFGIVRELTAGKTPIEGQDGGIVTSLLISGIEKEIFECAIVAERNDGFNATPIIAESEEDIIRSRGTKYIACPMVSKIGEAVKGGKRKIAIVGTPCEVRGIRKIQNVLLKNVPQIEITAIGLFCFESFFYDSLKEKTKSLLNVDLDEAEKTQITKGRYIVTVNGKEYSCKVSELDEAVRKNCLSCEDFTARLADISVGSVGSPDGFSTIIIRSEKGEKLLNSCDFRKGSVDRDEIARISSLKRKRLNDEE